MLIFLNSIALVIYAVQATTIETAPAFPMLNIKWQPYVPKYTEELPSHIKPENALIRVPQDYFGEYGKPGAKIPLRVRRFCRGEPKRNLWIVPGGPGGHSNTVEAFIMAHDIYMPENVWIYTMDHRGTGKSAKLLRHKEMGAWTHKVADQVRKLDFPLTIMSVHNAAMDLATVTSNLKQEGQTWYLMGESYGAYLSDFAYRLGAARQLFNGVILDGYMPVLYHEDSEEDIRHNIADNCSRNVECKALIDPNDILHLAEKVQAANNECVDMLLKYVNEEFQTSLREQRGYAIRLFNRAVIQEFSHIENQAILIAFLQAAVACPDKQAFRVAIERFRTTRLLNKDTDKDKEKPREKHPKKDKKTEALPKAEPKKDETLPKGSEPTAVPPSKSEPEKVITTPAGEPAPPASSNGKPPESAGNSLNEAANVNISSLPQVTEAKKGKVKKIHNKNSYFLLNLIRYSEKANDVGKCTPDNVSFLSFCEMLDDDVMANFLRPHLYNPKLAPKNDSDLRQVIIIAAKSDTQTLHDRAKQQFERITPKHKSFYSLDYAPHVSMGYIGCEMFILEQLMAETDAQLQAMRQLAEKCVQRNNSLHRSWYFIDEDIRSLWPVELEEEAEESTIVSAPKMDGGQISNMAAGLSWSETIFGAEWYVFVIAVTGVLVLPLMHALFVMALDKSPSV